MQTDHNELYKKTALRTGKQEEIYKEIGNFVFKSLSQHIKRPEKLIIKLKGVGRWYLRKNRMEQTLELFPPDFENRPKEGDGIYERLKILQYENKVEIYNLFKQRVEDYKKYVEQKSKIREIRNATQQLLEPEREEDSAE